MMKRNRRDPGAENRKRRSLFAVALAGDHALRAMASGSRWQILAVFPKGIYCRNGAGELLFLGPPSIGAGPLNALCLLPDGWDWRAEGIDPATPVRGDGQTLVFDDRLEFSFAEAGRWRAAELSGTWDMRVATERLPVLADQARRKAPAEGLGSLIPFFPLRGQCPPDLRNPMLLVARRGIRPLFGWLTEKLSAKPGATPHNVDCDAIRVLVGLGPGLTPSGDDLLGGMMITLHTFGQQDLARELGNAVLAQAPPLTNTISLAHLRCAAGGEGAQVLHDTLRALSVRSDHRLAECIERIASIGYTSGWDALAGLMLVMTAWRESEPIPDNRATAAKKPRYWRQPRREASGRMHVA